jgi:hypothetical protein
MSRFLATSVGSVVDPFVSKYIIKQITIVALSIRFFVDTHPDHFYVRRVESKLAG